MWSVVAVSLFVVVLLMDSDCDCMIDVIVGRRKPLHQWRCQLWTPEAIITPHWIIRSRYTGHWWLGCYIWYSPAQSPPRCIIKCNSPASQCTNCCIAIWWCVALQC